MRKAKVVISNIVDLPKQLSIGLINLYQLLLSPDHSWLKAKFPHGYCKFYPSCSQYSKEAIIKFGFFKGWYLGAKRIVRCHPWAEPKVDLIPNS